MKAEVNRSVILEKEIMLTVEYPFLMSMDYFFEDKYRLYFVMKFIEGAELF